MARIKKEDEDEAKGIVSGQDEDGDELMEEADQDDKNHEDGS